MVYLRDLGSKNGAYLGDEPLARDRDVPWKPQLALALGHTVIALDEPLAATLARLEAAADDPMAEDEVPPEPPSAIADAAPSVAGPDTGHAGDAPMVAMPPSVLAPPAPPKTKSGWSPVDVAVVIAALVVLVLSIAGMTWLLK
jgi:pSer/pThr/pTyr-binding forkhead associated (FHA) protein